jgi:hypothetical protein
MASTTILFTANARVGRPFLWARTQAGSIREATNRSVRRVVEIAESTKADGLVFAGSLFDDRYCTPIVRSFLADLFADTKIPILLVPGQSDPLHETSPYLLTSWPVNVTVVTTSQYQPFQIGGANVWVAGRHQHSAAASDIPTLTGGPERLEILVAGESQTVVSDAHCYSFVCQPGNAFEALGDTAVIGPPQRHEFQYSDPGSVVSIRIDGSSVTATAYPTECLTFDTFEIQITPNSSLATVKADVRRALDRSDGAVRVVFVGQTDEHMRTNGWAAEFKRSTPVCFEDRSVLRSQDLFERERSDIQSTFVRLVKESGSEAAEQILSVGTQALNGETSFGVFR